MSRRRVAGVMGSGADRHDDLARPLGQLLATLGVDLLTGGGQGVMAAVSEAFYNTPNRQGRVIGIIPCVQGEPAVAPGGYPNPWVETAIFTHLWKSSAEVESRNHINILSSDAIVALPGSDGTQSEVELALKYKGRSSLIAYLGQDGTIGNKFTVDSEEIEVARKLSEVETFLRKNLKLPKQ